MEIQVEQRICLKFCYSNKISASDALKMLQTTYGDSALSRARVFQWYKSFEEGRTSVENLPHERSKIKVMLTVFFDYEGVVHSEFLPQGRSVNAEYYLDVLKRLRENIRLKRKELWDNKSWFLHHDNAPAHTSRLVRDYLNKNNVNIVPQAPYSPDMAPCDFFLFPKLKLPLRGKHFETIEVIKENSKKELKSIPKSAFQKCYDDWKKRWHMCIASNGDYFEGDKIKIEQ